MKRYFIKKTYVATEKNTNNLGQTQIWYHCKKGTILHDWEIEIPYILNNYAYSRLCDAKRALKSVQESADWETNIGWWKVTCEIVEVEVN